jgi:Flp pilus assembly secretin CpaC
LRGPSERAAIEKRVRSLYPLAQIELESLPDNSPTVHFEVFLLELKKSRFHTLGLAWPAFQESAFRVTTSSISNLLQLDLTLQSLEGEGSLKILSNPELVVRAPGEAELFSGGEIPIQTHTEYISAVAWKNFGLTLKLSVAQSAGDKVRLDISTEVSHLDSTLSNEKIPGIQANRMKTQVDAQYGKPLLLSGLLEQNLRREAKGLPFLREIPVLGTLFGSEDYLSERSELVAILVPSKELPQNPMSRVSTFLPKGALPIARAPAQPAKPPKIGDDPSAQNFPWNVLE